ncbi:MAG: hypothetical protein Q9209_002195 [Squamulea sp. 1 TL-2023]
MAFFSCLLSPSTDNRHRSYRAFLRKRSLKPRLLAKFPKLASIPVKGCRKEGYSRIVKSEDVLPYGKLDELPNYEEIEAKDTAEDVCQSLMLLPKDDLRRFDRHLELEDLDLHLTVVDAHLESRDSHNTTVRHEFWPFMKTQMDDITARREKLEQQVEAMRMEVEEAKQQNADERRLNEILRSYLEAERVLKGEVEEAAEQVLVDNVEAAQKQVRRQQRGNQQRALTTRRCLSSQGTTLFKDEMGEWWLSAQERRTW